MRGMLLAWGWLGLPGAGCEAAPCGFVDHDEDGYGDEAARGAACRQEVADVAGDCDDWDADIHPDAVEVPYDGLDNDCDDATPDDDLDGDGVGFGADCDDANPDVGPHLEEIPNDGLDNDCDDATPDDDKDGDGHADADDCDDTDPAVYLAGTVEIDVSVDDLDTLCLARCVAGTVVDGSLRLVGAGGSDLSELACVAAVTGDLVIDGGQLTDLEGLQHLETVGGDARLLRIPRLTALAGLEGLVTVDGTLAITDNASLRTLRDLVALRDVRGDLVVRDNPELPVDAGADLATSVEVGGTGSYGANGDYLDVTDAGFESGDTFEPPRPVYWQSFPDWEGLVAVARTGSAIPGTTEPFTARSGDAGLRMVADFDEPTPFGEIIAFQDRHDPVPGDEMELSGWYFVPSTDPLAPACEAMLSVRSWGGGIYLGATDSATIDTTLHQDQWTHLTVILTVEGAPDVVQPGPMLRVPDEPCTGSIYWDDLAFLKVGPL